MSFILSIHSISQLLNWKAFLGQKPWVWQQFIATHITERYREQQIFLHWLSFCAKNSIYFFGFQKNIYKNKYLEYKGSDMKIKISFSSQRRNCFIQRSDPLLWVECQLLVRSCGANCWTHISFDELNCVELSRNKQIMYWIPSEDYNAMTRWQVQHRIYYINRLYTFVYKYISRQNMQ